MTKQEMLDTSKEMKRESGKFCAKAFGWTVLLGLALKGLVTNYALSSNHNMMSKVLDEAAKNEGTET